MNQRTEQEIMKNWKTHDRPLVSICCTAYNHEPYIEEAIESFLMQETDFPFEVLVHDDCSTDNTANIIREYEKKYPNIIKPIYQKENQYSKGIKISATFIYPGAKGEYIALCEGDDHWNDPEKLQIQLDLMLEHPECHLSFHPAKELLDNEIGKTIAKHSNKNKIFSPSEIILGGGEFCPTASLVFKKEAVLDLPDWFYTEAPVGDHYMQIFGSLKGGALYIDRNMSIHRIGHSGSWTTIMKEKDNISVESLIENRKNHTFRHIKTLEYLGNFTDQKYREAIDRKISERLFTLAILYLKNDRYQDFKKMVVRSQEIHKSTFLQRVVYYFRFAPSILKTLIKLRKIF